MKAKSGYARNPGIAGALTKFVIGVVMAMMSVFGHAGTNPNTHWTIVSVFAPSPSAVDFPYQQALIAFKRNIEASTNITVDIIWSNEIPAHFPGGVAEVFEKVKAGRDVQITHGLPRNFIFNDARDSFKDIFENLPFGPNTREFQTWVKFGGGQELYNEFYAPDGLLPFVGGDSGAQVGGWFSKEMNQKSDFNGLRIRIAGFASEVLNDPEFGAIAFPSPVGDVIGLIQSGAVDAAELCCPVTDTNFGVADETIAQGWIYHFPGWHEPHGAAQFLFNKRVFERLTHKEQEIVRRAMEEAADETDLIFNNKNRIALQGLIAKGVKIHRFPDSLLRDLRSATQRVVFTRLQSITAFDNLSTRIINSTLSFTAGMGEYGRISEGGYYATREIGP